MSETSEEKEVIKEDAIRSEGEKLKVSHTGKEIKEDEEKYRPVIKAFPLTPSPPSIRFATTQIRSEGEVCKPTMVKPPSLKATKPVVAMFGQKTSIPMLLQKEPPLIPKPPKYVTLQAKSVLPVSLVKVKEPPKIEVAQPLIIKRLETFEKQIKVETPVIKPLKVSTVIPPVTQVTLEEISKITEVAEGKLRKPPTPRPGEEQLAMNELEELMGLLKEVGDFYDLFLDAEHPDGKGLGDFIRTMPDRPALIVVSKPQADSCIHSVTLLCREFYRVAMGGRPELARFIKPKDPEEFRRELSLYGKVGGRLLVVEDMGCELLLKEGHENIRKVLEERYLELLQQGFGFLIFHVGEGCAKEFYSSLLPHQHKVPYPLFIHPKRLDNEAKSIIAELAWCFVTPHLSAGELDDFFGEAEKRLFEVKLREVLKDRLLMHHVKPDEDESEEHYLMKAWVVKIKAKELGIKTEEIPNHIKVEEEIEGIKPDVKVGEECIEVETLYGQSFNPITYKIDHKTLSKYKGLRFRVSLVMMTLPLLTYAKDLVELAKIYRDKHGIKVNIYALDVEDERLRPLKEVIQELKASWLYGRRTST